MAQHGVYANRNRSHRDRQLTLLSQAGTDWDRLAAAYDGFRAGIRLLEKRRQPLGTPAGAHREQAAELVRQEADRLEQLVRQLYAGDFDAAREVA